MKKFYKKDKLYPSYLKMRTLSTVSIYAVVIALSFLSSSAMAVTTMKPAIKGLVDMGNIAFYHHPNKLPQTNLQEIKKFASSFSGVVINVTWQQLQPDGPRTLQSNSIDKVLTAIKFYNRQHPNSPLSAKLRVWGGLVAPSWVKGIVGTPIYINSVNPHTGEAEAGTIGYFWAKPYNQAWQNLQTMLAKKYDKNSLISEVAITSCASNTDEPFVSWLDKATRYSLQQHGYTDAKQKACLSNALTDYKAWRHTYLDFAFNSFHDINGNKVKPDQAFTLQVMQQCYSAGNCILSNHALNMPLSKLTQFIYTQMASYSKKNPRTLIDLQTVSPKKLNWRGAIKNAIKYHTQSVELWPVFGGFTTLQPKIVASFAAALKS